MGCSRTRQRPNGEQASDHLAEAAVPRSSHWSRNQMNPDTQTPPNYRAGVDAGFGALFGFGRPWPGTTQHER